MPGTSASESSAKLPTAEALEYPIASSIALRQCAGVSAPCSIRCSRSSVVKILALTCVQPWAPHGLQSSLVVPRHSSHCTRPLALHRPQSSRPSGSQLLQARVPCPEQEIQVFVLLPLQLVHVFSMPLHELQVFVPPRHDGQSTS